jgi:tRNA-2-methylthio-N6-dimethylallyladenosine synthase
MTKKLFIETYGCQMNVADSEVVASVMQMAGYETTDDIAQADSDEEAEDPILEISEES